MFETCRILIYIGFDTNGKAVEEVLERFGINCSYRIASSKEEFRKLVRLFNPDVVLIGYPYLLNVDGTGISEVKYTLEYNSSIPVIIIAESINKTVLETCLKEGATFCVPVNNLDQLAPAVKFGLVKGNAIREKEKLLHKLTARERYYRNILKYMHDEVVIIADDYTITDINNSVLNITGHRREEILGKPCYKVFFGFNSPCFEHGMECYHTDVLSTGTTSRFQRKYKDKDGKERWMDVIVSPLFNEHKKVSHVIESFRDITEHVEMKEKVNKLSNAVEQSASAIIILNLSGEIDYCNTAFTTFSGYSKEEALGKEIYKLLGNKGDEEKLENCLEILGDGSVKKIVRHSRRKDGGEYWVSSVVSGLFDADGKLKGIMEVQEDITARLKYEDQIKKDLEEKELLLHEIYHRVNNNLQIIISLLNMHLDNMKDSGGEAVLLSLMQRFETMAIIENSAYSGGGFISIDPGSIISDIFNMLTDSYGIPFGFITLSKEINVSGLNIKQLQTWALIINELLSNCIRHAFPEGKGAIIIKFHENNREGITLIVKDNGKGLPVGLEPRETSTVGFRLLHILGEGQLEGTIEFRKDNGTEVLVVGKKQ